jgi:hypothetical protein
MRVSGWLLQIAADFGGIWLTVGCGSLDYEPAAEGLSAEKLRPNFIC